jgi:hypothetical protein
MGRIGAVGGVARGCGTRQAGAAYVEFGAEDGVPWWKLLLCPPLPLTEQFMAQAGIEPIGVTFFQRGGDPTWHVYDWIGAAHYPNVLDFCWELHHFGGSRRLARNIDFRRLTKNSLFFFIHPRAVVLNARDYYWPPDGTGYRGANVGRAGCPLSNREHTIGSRAETNPAMSADPSLSCAGVWWEDVTGGITTEDLVRQGTPPVNLSAVEESDHRFVVRTMPSFSYRARKRPEGVTPRYQPAIFLRMRPARLVVVRGGDPREYDQTLDAISESSLPVAEVDS